MILTCIKSDQTVLLHPSTVLAQESEWLIYNEYGPNSLPSLYRLPLTNNRFVLTSKNYIRTVTQIKPEWLFEISPVYYDLETFPKSEVKSALDRVLDKQKRQEALNGRSKGRSSKR